MSNKPQLLRRATHVAAVLALSLPALAPAIQPAFNPNTTPSVIPYTSTSTELWKFVGTYNYGGTDPVSGVQVHPWWVLATKHAKPSVGLTYTNAYGTAQFSWCAPNHASEDISLCLINPPINPPAGVQFPKLLVDGRSVFPTSKKGQATGYLYGTGFGLPTRGTQSAAWATPNGQAVGYHPLTQPNLVAPHKGAGDSGSGLFWFAQGKTEGVLTAINYSDQDFIVGGAHFSPSVKAWIETYATELNWITAAEYAPERRATPPQAVEVQSTTANSASIKITKPNLLAGDTLTGYFLAATKLPGTTLAYMDSVDNQNLHVPYTFTGLQTNQTYRFCAFSYNDMGLGNFSGENIPLPECSTFKPTNPPAAPTNLQVTLIATPAAGVFQYRLTWTAPPAIAGATVTGYRFNIPGLAYNGNSVPAPQTSFDEIVVTTGQKPFTVSVSALNELTAGPASNTVTVP